MGKDLSKSLVQPPAQVRASCGIRPGSLGLCLVGYWKPPRKEPTQLLWVTSSTAWLPLWGMSQSVPLFVSNYSYCLLSSHCAPLRRVWLHLHDTPPPNHLFSRLNEPRTLSFSSWDKCSSPDGCGVPVMNSCQVFDVPLALGGPKNWTQYLKVV